MQIIHNHDSLKGSPRLECTTRRSKIHLQVEEQKLHPLREKFQRKGVPFGGRLTVEGENGVAEGVEIGCVTPTPAGEV